MKRNEHRCRLRSELRVTFDLQKKKKNDANCVKGSERHRIQYPPAVSVRPNGLWAWPGEPIRKGLRLGNPSRPGK